MFSERLLLFKSNQNRRIKTDLACLDEHALMCPSYVALIPSYEAILYTVYLSFACFI